MPPAQVFCKNSNKSVEIYNSLTNIIVSCNRTANAIAAISAAVGGSADVHSFAEKLIAVPWLTRSFNRGRCDEGRLIK
ncbi:hypothetical protein SMSP1_01730 [Sedimentisphaera salicampi]|nr:hypothetical protein SMSP1_01730 [Sedimentisphaera salicampi]